MQDSDFSTQGNNISYNCIFSERYGSDEIREIWGDKNKRILWRKIWVALAKAQSELGIADEAQYNDIKKHQSNLNVSRSLEIEDLTKHDLLSEARCYAEQCVDGGAIIHLGATSADIEDNTDVIRIRSSLLIIISKLEKLLLKFSERIEETSAVTTMGYTHLQAAEPTTVGYRLSQYAYDLSEDYKELKRIYPEVLGKGMKGAVGTSASFIELFINKGNSHEKSVLLKDKMEHIVMDELGLKAHPLSTQTYTRRQDIRVMSIMSSISASIYRFCQDLRILQTPLFGEIFEPRGAEQVGSSTMPFKRNPSMSEGINSLCRIINNLSGLAWSNHSQTILERTLDDSASRQFMYPSTFIALDSILDTATELVAGLEIDSQSIKRNLSRFNDFSLTEKILMHSVMAGANRQDLHEHLRKLCMETSKDMSISGNNNLIDILSKDPIILKFINKDEILKIFNEPVYVGNAIEISRELSKEISQLVNLK